jgi:hypothetical protein
MCILNDKSPRNNVDLIDTVSGRALRKATQGQQGKEVFEMHGFSLMGRS